MTAKALYDLATAIQWVMVGSYLLAALVFVFAARAAWRASSPRLDALSWFCWCAVLISLGHAADQTYWSIARESAYGWWPKLDKFWFEEHAMWVTAIKGWIDFWRIASLAALARWFGATWALTAAAAVLLVALSAVFALAYVVGHQGGWPY